MVAFSTAAPYPYGYGEQHHGGHQEHGYGNQNQGYGNPHGGHGRHTDGLVEGLTTQLDFITV